MMESKLETEPRITNIVTPRLLKVEVEDDSYRKAWKSYKFGQLTPLTQKWYIWVVLAVVGIFAILIVTGNFSMPR